jgi:hypothetical protein
MSKTHLKEKAGAVWVIGVSAPAVVNGDLQTRRSCAVTSLQVHADFWAKTMGPPAHRSIEPL